MPTYSAETFLVELKKDTAKIGDSFNQATENTLALINGQNTVSLALPRGTRTEVMTGPIALVMKNLGLPIEQTVADLPIHALIPCLDAESMASWAVPGLNSKKTRPSLATVFYQDGYQPRKNDRPLLTLGLRPSIPGDLQYPEIWAGTGYWQPHKKSGTLPVIISDSALAFSLGERKPITNIKYLIDINRDDQQLVYTPLLTAGKFTQGLMDWLNAQSDDGLLIQDHQVIDAISALSNINPGLKVFWERLAARQELGAILAMHDPGGHAIAAALNCFIEAPDEATLEIRNGAIAEITQAVAGNQISDWISLSRCIGQAFGKNIPLGLRIGSTSILNFLEQSIGLSLNANPEAKKAIERTFSIDGKPFDLLLPGDTLSLLIVDPRIINKMVSGILNRWVPEMLGIVDATIMGGQAALRTQKVILQVQANAWDAASKAVAGEANKVIHLARKAGRNVGRVAVQQIEDDLNTIIQAAANTGKGNPIINVISR